MGELLTCGRPRTCRVRLVAASVARLFQGSGAMLQRPWHARPRGAALNRRSHRRHTRGTKPRL